jgi:hypothetical protein
MTSADVGSTPLSTATSPSTVNLNATSADSSNASMGELLSDISRDFSTLMRQEVELAKAEVKESATRAGRGAGMFAGAGVAGHMVLIFLSIALWWALGNSTGRGWSALIVAAVWLAIAAVLALRGKKEMQNVNGLPRTADTAKKIPNAAKGHEELNR